MTGPWGERHLCLFCAMTKRQSTERVAAHQMDNAKYTIVNYPKACFDLSISQQHKLTQHLMQLFCIKFFNDSVNSTRKPLIRFIA